MAAPSSLSQPPGQRRRAAGPQACKRGSAALLALLTGGKTSREPIGVYDPSAPPKKLEPTLRGYGIAAALEKCRELADIHASRAETGGLRAGPRPRAQGVLWHRRQPMQRSPHAPCKSCSMRMLGTSKGQGRRSHVDAQPDLQASHH